MPKYLGVIIHKVKDIIPGSDLKELKDGRLVPCKPQFEVSYQYAGSYPYDTLAECKASIDATLKSCKEVGGECRPKEFAAIMNTEEDLK